MQRMPSISHVQRQLLARKSESLAAYPSPYRPDLLVQGPQSRSFLLDSGIFVAIPAPGAARQIIFSYQVPPATLAVLSQLAIIANGPANFFTDGSGQIIWRMFVNGAPVKGMNNITAQIGTIEQPVSWWLVLRPNDLLTITVEVPAGQEALAAGSITGARIYGYLDNGAGAVGLPGVGYGQGAQVPGVEGGRAQVPRAIARRFRR